MPQDVEGDERGNRTRGEAALKEMDQSGCRVFQPPQLFGEYIYVYT